MERAEEFEDEEQPGRSEEFEDGANRVRQPEFESVQRQHLRNYSTNSVLGQLRPSQNGLGGPDYERRLVGVPRSPIGMGDETYDKHLWMGASREPSQRLEQTRD